MNEITNSKQIMVKQVESQPMPKVMQERVMDIISWRLNVPASRIHPYTRFQDDLNLDAVDRLLLIAELESRFNVYLSSEEVNAIETIHDASLFLEQHAA
jgi:acyl carrier protein